MPTTKSAVKRVKTSERNRVKNLAYKTEIKSIIKKVAALVSKNDTQSAQQTANKAFSLIDRCTTKGILHKNNAAKKKSRISTWLKSLEKK